MLCIDAKLLVFFKRIAIEVGIIIKSNAVKAKVHTFLPFKRRAIPLTTLDMIKRCGTKRKRRLGCRLATTKDMDIGGIIGTGSRSNGAVGENIFVNCQCFRGACRHQHYIYKFLFNDLGDDIAKFRKAAIFSFPMMSFRRFTRGCYAQRHIWIFSICKNKILAQLWVGMNALQF